MALFSHDTKVEALGKAPLFAGLSKAELGELAKVTEDLDFSTGKVFCTQGEVGSDFFVLMEGEAEVTRDGSKIATHGPGDFFGEIALVEDVPRTATVTDTAPVRCFVVHRGRFMRLLDEQPEVERKVLRALARRLIAASDDPSL
jgi:CRP/FNR family cyclic AMP-dependent transcriptional regulator